MTRSSSQIDTVYSVLKTPFYLRRATKEDGTHIEHVIAKSLVAYNLDYGLEEGDNDFADLAAAYSGKNDRFYTLVELDEHKNEHIVGGGGFREVLKLTDSLIGVMPEVKTCILRKMYFSPDIQGKGLGRAMVERYLDEARALGYKRMILDTNATMVKAIHLYKSYGFTQFGDTECRHNCDRRYELTL